MQSDKNKLIEQTEAQRNPRLARPEDFKIAKAEHVLPVAGHGQHGSSRSEYARLLQVRDYGKAKSQARGQKLATEVDHAGKPHSA